jgi:hypothetical protein
MFVVAAVSSMGVVRADTALVRMGSVTTGARPVPRHGHIGMPRVFGLRWASAWSGFSVLRVCMHVGVIIALMSYFPILHASSAVTRFLTRELFDPALLIPLP